MAKAAATRLPTLIAPVGDEDAHPRRWIALAVATLGAFMVLVDTTIVNVAIPSIRVSLAATYADTQWVVAGYQLAYATMLVTGGRLGDLLGRRRLFMAGVVGFTLTSALGGAAQSPGMLIGSRIAQGMTGALLFPQGLSMIQSLFPKREHARAFGVFGAAAGLAIVLGPLLGGLIVGDGVGGDSWRLVFLVNVPVGAAALTAAARVLPESRAAGAQGIDVGGVALVSLGLFGVTFPLLEGRDANWAPWVWICAAAGALVLAGFVLYESRRGRRGVPVLVDPAMFGDRSFSAGSLLAFLLFVGIPSWLFTFNLTLQAGLGYGALHAGLTTLGFSAGVVCGAALGERLEPRLGVRGLLGLGAVLATGGCAATIAILSARGAAVTGIDFTPALLAIGLGFGTTVPRLLAVVLGRVGSAEAGAASGVLTSIQQVGGALGVTVAGVVLFGLLGTPAATPVRGGAPQTAAATAFTGAERTALLFNTGVLALAVLVVPALPRSERTAHRPGATVPV